MKNTTKKILSMLLAVVMLLSVMPVAYASPAEYPPEVEQYLDIAARFESYGENKYEDDSVYSNTIRVIISSALDTFEGLGYDSPPPLGEDNDYTDVSYFSDFNKCMQPAIDEIEAKIASGEIIVIVDTYKYFKLYSVYAAGIQEDEGSELLNRIDALRKSENYKYAELFELSDTDILDCTTQAEFDAKFENIKPLLTMIIDCLDGNHLYGEYISNNDATEEADGTKTATCEFCGATDTVVDEGSKIDNNDNSKCSCNCHKSGIIGFIWKIINFFYKIFGMNKTCACGVAHY